MVEVKHVEDEVRMSASLSREVQIGLAVFLHFKLCTHAVMYRVYACLAVSGVVQLEGRKAAVDVTKMPPVLPPVSDLQRFQLFKLTGMVPLHVPWQYHQRSFNRNGYACKYMACVVSEDSNPPSVID